MLHLLAVELHMRIMLANKRHYIAKQMRMHMKHTIMHITPKDSHTHTQFQSPRWAVRGYRSQCLHMAHNALKCERPLVVPVRDGMRNQATPAPSMQLTDAVMLKHLPKQRTALKDAAHGTRNARQPTIQLLQEDQR